MCLAIPAKVVELLPDRAVVDVVGVRRSIDTGLLVDDPPRVGDWVLVHVGFAMAKIDQQEADLTLEAVKQMGQAYYDEIEAFDSTSII